MNIKNMVENKAKAAKAASWELYKLGNLLGGSRHRGCA